MSTTTKAPAAVFVAPALTTTFTPPPECTSQHLTMLESDAFRIWMNEPQPVPNSTFSDCYPPQFMTSFLEMKSSTVIPAFSPLVCPDNYHTVFQQSENDRPLYIACCPSAFELAMPSSSTPGRPAYGGTCYSNIGTVTVTQYDNSSSSGVTEFAPSTTGAQAYAHPIDGFVAATTTALFAAATSTSTSGTSASPSPSLSNRSAAGLVAGLLLLSLMLLALAFFYLRGRKLRGIREKDAAKWTQRHIKGPFRHKYLDEKNPLPPPPMPRDLLASYSTPRRPSETNSETSLIYELPHKLALRHELDANPTPRESMSPKELASTRSECHSSRIPSRDWPTTPGARSSVDLMPQRRSLSRSKAGGFRSWDSRRSARAWTGQSSRSLSLMFSPARTEVTWDWRYSTSPISPTGSLWRREER